MASFPDQFKMLARMGELMRSKRVANERVLADRWGLDLEELMAASVYRAMALKDAGSSMVATSDDIGTYMVMGLLHGSLADTFKTSATAADKKLVLTDIWKDVITGIHKMYAKAPTTVQYLMTVPADTVTDANVKYFLTALVKSDMAAQFVRSQQKALVAFIISMSNQGTVSADFLRSRNKELSLALNNDIQLDKAQIESVWIKFGIHISMLEAQWAEFFQALDEFGGKIPLRLGLIARQAKYAGLSPAVLLSRAIAGYKKFPWKELDKLVSENGDAMKAIEWCRAHPYGAFQIGQESKYKSTMYPNFLYTGLKLLIVAGGEGSVKGYGGSFGGNQTVKLKSTIDDWVEQFVAGLSADKSYPTTVDEADLASFVALT